MGGKRDLRITYGILRDVQDQAEAYKKAVEAMEEALNKMEPLLEQQESEAITELYEQQAKLGKDLTYYKGILGSLWGLLGDYIEDMTGLIKPINENAEMRVDRNDIWINVKEIGRNIKSMKGIANDTYGSTVNHYYGPEPGVGTPQEDIDRRNALIQEYEKGKAAREANYREIAKFRSGVAAQVDQKLEMYYDEIEDIYRKYVIEYENTDDEYETVGFRVYRECTNVGEFLWDQLGSLKDILDDIALGVGSAAVDTVTGILALGYNVVKLVAATAVCVVTAPCGVTPDWASEYLVNTKNVTVNVLKHPLRTGAGIGQNIFDTVDEKGLVYGWAYVATDILITKGIGKLAETAKASRMAATKLDDVGRVANVTEDVGKGVKAVDEAEDAGKGVKAVDAVEDAGKGTGASSPTGSKSNQMNQPKNPSYQPVRNKPTKIGGRNYSGHALDRMQDRGIMPSVVENTVKVGKSTPSYGGTVRYYDSANNITVIINSKGKVVTVTYGGK